MRNGGAIGWQSQLGRVRGAAVIAEETGFSAAGLLAAHEGRERDRVWGVSCGRDRTHAPRGERCEARCSATRGLGCGMRSGGVCSERGDAQPCRVCGGRHAQRTRGEGATTHKERGLVGSDAQSGQCVGYRVSAGRRTTM
eukprot:2503474-Prymnesium_polylepis.1